MFVFDTDTLSLLEHGHERVTARIREADEGIATTVISRIEILKGRFDSILKAEDGERFVLAYQRLEQSEARLMRVPILGVTAAAAQQFDQLRNNKKLKKIGRADLLIACITLANKATLVTRNLK